MAGTLAALIADPRDPAHITYTVEDVLRARMLAISCGYPDGNDLGLRAPKCTVAQLRGACERIRAEVRERSRISSKTYAARNTII